MAGTPKKREALARIAAAGGIEAIAERIANGETQKEIAESVGCTQQRLGFWLHRADNEPIFEAAMRARADKFAEELIGIADSDPERTDRGTIDPGDIAHKALRINTRKWVAARLNPRRYAERALLDGAVNVSHNVAITTLVQQLAPGSQRLVPPPGLELPHELPHELPRDEDEDDDDFSAFLGGGDE